MRGKQKAANAGGFGRLWRATETPSQENGLRTNFKSACIRAHGRGMMPVPRSITGCRLGGLKLTRRTIAAPSRGVFLWSVVQTHGVIASRFFTGVPCGNPSGLLSPCGQSANPRGVAHHLGGLVNDSENLFSQGA